jgi:hypothetical protein
MTDDEIKALFKEECLSKLTDIICNPILKIKNADFELKIKQTLEILDCEAFNMETRNGFRIFAKELLSKIDEQ